MRKRNEDQKYVKLSIRDPFSRNMRRKDSTVIRVDGSVPSQFEKSSFSSSDPALES